MYTTVEPSVSVTTPSLHVLELKPPPDQYKLQQLILAAPDVPRQSVKEVCVPAYPSARAASYPTDYPEHPPKYYCNSSYSVEES